MAILTKLTEVVVTAKVLPVFGGTADVNTGDTYSRSEATPAFSRGPDLAGIMRSSISGLTFEIAGSGTAGTAPATNAFFEMCGLIGTNAPATSETYAHNATISATATSVAVYQGDTILNTCVEAVGDLTITGKAGKPLMGTIDCHGKWTAPTEASNATTLSDDADAPIVKGSTMTLATDNLVWRSYEFKTNNTITERPDLSDASGIEAPLITDMNHTITLVAETPAFSTANYWTSWLAGTKMAFSMVVGSVAGNIITQTADVYHTAAPQLSEEGGIQLVTLQLRVGELAGDSKYALAFT